RFFLEKLRPADEAPPASASVTPAASSAPPSIAARASMAPVSLFPSPERRPLDIGAASVWPTALDAAPASRSIPVRGALGPTPTVVPAPAPVPRLTPPAAAAAATDDLAGAIAIVGYAHRLPGPVPVWDLL